jgi:hypothetical protein
LRSLRPKLVAEDWQDEVANDIAFLWSTLKVDDGLFHRRKDNPFMENLMNEAVVDICRTLKTDKKKKKIMMTRCRDDGNR